MPARPTTAARSRFLPELAGFASDDGGPGAAAAELGVAVLAPR